ncbi:hypothetical protein CWI49_00300, partial [Neisseria meningitidis]|uniref:hypothetical protein n=1 Tax=Neisseria meningitidis TaxID=487 RepID=UPI000CC7C310
MCKRDGEYEADKKRRLGEEGAKPKRIKYKPVTLYPPKQCRLKGFQAAFLQGSTVKNSIATLKTKKVITAAAISSA